MTTTTALAINIPLMVLAFALMSGIPLWMVLRHPDRQPERTVPQYRRARQDRVARQDRAARRAPVASAAWNS